MEAPDLTTVKDFFRFCAAKGKGKIVEQITCDSLNSVTEWLFGGFCQDLGLRRDRPVRIVV